ncbi:MAG TPA: M14 family metallopeptidase [Geminicoccaceae bacterium]|mgnify:CR=1 FL=1|nr:M14 family metallopeptidase [Geminicoccus sp.]HMU50747.1 M14 family metallopeptidase [Geminicoccaceae bacterium]
MRTTRIDLPAAAPGTERHLLVHRLGRPGSSPKAYLQAAIHADELPGVMVLRHLMPMLEAAEAEGRLRGEVVLVPMANPIGAAQGLMQSHLGRYDLVRMSNFNRGWPDFTAQLADRVAERLGDDAESNVAVIRAELRQLAEELPAGDENRALRRELCRLAVDADLVLDLHCDLEAAMHLYLGTPLWPGAADLSAEIGAEAVMLDEASGGSPFDEVFSAPWWVMARRFPDRPIPLACLAATIEYRGIRDVEDGLARGDAEVLLRFLVRRGVVDGAVQDLPIARCEATPLTGAAMIEAPASGIVLFDVTPGEEVEAGQRVARLVDPLQRAEVAVATPVSGRVFARSLRGFARAGDVIVKVAGREPIAGRGGSLLPN